ncbi:MAG TPA: hypothetical protein VHA35_10120 [Dongiaceae bacterium]|jgi:hypothetical protein|nr:hypothetical protein [Dongiaceae bacterium]
MLIEPRRNILIGPLLQIALRRCWAQRDHLLRLGIVPVALIVAIAVPLRRALEAMRLSMSPNGIGDPDLAARCLMLAVAYGFVVAVFAVNWLRQLTLGTRAAPGLGLALNMRHLRFFCAVLAIAMAAMVPVMLVLYPIFVVALQGEAALVAVAAMGSMVWAALLARLSPSWIGIAIDAPMRLSLAWRRTAGQGFKLVVALLAVEVGALLGQQVVATVFEITGLAHVAPMTYLLITAIVDLAAVAVELAVLVTAFPYFLRETV